MGKLMFIDNVDICCGLCWGDEAKGKLVTELLKKNKYNFVCRWSGGSNAGHTIYLNGKKSFISKNQDLTKVLSDLIEENLKNE